MCVCVCLYFANSSYNTCDMRPDHGSRPALASADCAHAVHRAQAPVVQPRGGHCAQPHFSPLCEALPEGANEVRALVLWTALAVRSNACAHTHTLYIEL